MVVTLSRMYCKFRLREEEQHLREKIEQARLDIERDHRREILESRRKLDDLAIRVIEREMARRSRDDTGADTGTHGDVQDRQDVG